MKLAVFGQRAIEDTGAVISRLLELSDEKGWDNEPLTYLYGGAKGPQAAVLEVMSPHHDCVLFQPWSMVTSRLGKFNVDFFDYRNKQIIDNADEVVIFDDGSPDREADRVINYVRRCHKMYNIIKM